MKRLALGPGLLLLGLLAGSGLPASPLQRTATAPEQAAASPAVQRVVHEGISVEFSMQHIQPEAARRDFREGDDVLIRFAITDTSTGTPLSGVYPAAWMDLLLGSPTTSPDLCHKKAETFIGGSIFSAADLDLNVYYVLALNDDPTITVVDPLFGFGGTQMLAMISLAGRGSDWALDSRETRLFVAMEEADGVAVVSTYTWLVQSQLQAGRGPHRIALQPDQYYLWVGHLDSAADAGDSGVAVFTSRDLQPAARIATGAGRHDLAFSSDSRWAAVTNSEQGTVSLIDVRRLAKVRDVATGDRPSSISFSPLANAFYVSHEGEGGIAVIDPGRDKPVATLPVSPGVSQIRFAPGGRLGFAVNPTKDEVYILDASLNRVMQTGDMMDQPDQVSFSDELAYIRHRGNETVLMIPLGEVGVEEQPVPVIDFPGGEYPPGKTAHPTPAAGIVQAPGANAVLVANPLDKAIYYYKEGMAAPMGTFSNYGRQPRAPLVVDRSLQERSARGVYETVVRLRKPGQYDVVFFMDSPRIVHCFQAAVSMNPEAELKRRTGGLHVQHLTEKRTLEVGKASPVRFRILNPDTGLSENDLSDVNVMIYLAPGIWHSQHWAKADGSGVYSVEVTPPRPGYYYVHVQIRSRGMSFNNPQYLILEAVSSGEEK